MMRRRWIPAVALLAIAAGGCGEEGLTAPEGMAMAEVYLRDGDGSTARSRSSASRSVAGQDASSDGGAPPRQALAAGGSGELEVTARVFVQAESGGWVELTNGAVTRSVAASESGTTKLAEAAIQLSSYSRVRVEFERVRGSVTGSVLVSIGGADSQVSVDLGSDGRAVVEREVRFTARSDATSRLVVDLNSDAWVADRTAANSVMEGSFTGAVEVFAEEG